jgi:hypothetical protein
MIRETYASFEFDTVIAEGGATSWGISQPPISDYVVKCNMSANGFAKGDETVPTVTRAQHQGGTLVEQRSPRRANQAAGDQRWHHRTGPARFLRLAKPATVDRGASDQERSQPLRQAMG